MENKELEYRMYGLVPYNISPIQQGIQFGHGVVDYQLSHGTSDEYKRWSEFDKTFIILNGGTTNSNPANLGTLNQHLIELRLNKIPLAVFNEIDLGDQITSINFLVDERVFDNKKYPKFKEFLYQEHGKRDVDKKFRECNYNMTELISSLSHTDDYQDWVQSVGGEKNAFMKEFLTQFRLA